LCSEQHCCSCPPLSRWPIRVTYGCSKGTQVTVRIPASFFSTGYRRSPRGDLAPVRTPMSVTKRIHKSVTTRAVGCRTGPIRFVDTHTTGPEPRSAVRFSGSRISNVGTGHGEQSSSCIQVIRGRPRDIRLMDASRFPTPVGRVPPMVTFAKWWICTSRGHNRRHWWCSSEHGLHVAKDDHR
jgi:hypothetical protein